MQVLTISVHDLQVMLDRNAEKTAEKILSAVFPALQNYQDKDVWFNLKEFCDYHPDKPKQPTVYQWVCDEKVPVHKDGKKLRFLKSEIDEWLKTGKKTTEANAETDVDSFLSDQKKRRATI